MAKNRGASVDHVESVPAVPANRAQRRARARVESRVRSGRYDLGDGRGWEDLDEDERREIIEQFDQSRNRF